MRLPVCTNAPVPIRIDDSNKENCNLLLTPKQEQFIKVEAKFVERSIFKKII
jgi:hypothetical protein